MKIILQHALTVFFLLSFTFSQAQEKMDSYTNSYFGKTYNIDVSQKEKEYTVWIQAYSMDKLCKEGGLLIRYKQLPDFFNALSEAKAKYAEWVGVAKTNNVDKMEKTMSMKPTVDTYFSYGGWKFDSNVDLQFDFKILPNDGKPKYLLIVRTNELTASDNQYMKVDGFVLTFSTEAEIESFANSIAPTKVTSFLESKTNAKDLFKD